MPLKLAVLLSGSGTTLQNLIDRIGDGSLDAQIQCVVASREGVYGLERAKNYDIPAITVAREDPDSPPLTREAIEFLVPICTECHSERNARWRRLSTKQPIRPR